MGVGVGREQPGRERGMGAMTMPGGKGVGEPGLVRSEVGGVWWFDNSLPQPNLDQAESSPCDLIWK